MSDNVRVGPIPSLPMALAPLLLTVALLMTQFFVFGDFTPHIPLACGILICAFFARLRGIAWTSVEASMLKVIKLGLPAILILLAVGMLIGTWILSGTVPTLIYYGINLVSPGWFLIATCLISSLISLAVGTSWGTIGTVGLALMGIGQGLGIPVYLTAGALVSGAFFGDKMSPLSDTTNLTPAVCETDLWTHIKSMMATTVPAMTLALLIYGWLGAGYADQLVDAGGIDTLRQTLTDHFTLSWVTLIPPVVVISLSMARLPPFPTIFGGAALGGVIAILLQGSDVQAVFNVMQNGYVAETGNEAMDTLLSKGGAMSMTWVVTLTLFALGFTGMLEAYGTIDAIMTHLARLMRGRFSMVLTSSVTTASVGVVVGDVYTTLVLPGRLLHGQYKKMGYRTSVLSRTIEDNGTLLSPLIPWNMGGSFVAATTGVPTLLYAPFAFACWLSPLFGLLWALLGRFVPKDNTSGANASAPSAELDKKGGNNTTRSHELASDT